MSTKVNELTPKVDRYTVTDPDGQLSATEYNVILDAVQRHETQLVDNDFLRFSEQALDDNDKRQARQNIGVVGEGDYAPKMSVGFADNLIGRGEATAEEFTYRASAGMGRSITDDTARVKKIKGNSVVWNQMCDINNIRPLTSGSTIAQKNSDGSTTLTYYAEGITNWSGIKVDEKESQYFLASHIYGIWATISPDFPVRVGFTANGRTDPFIFPMGVKTSNLFIITVPTDELVAIYVKATDAINSNLTTQIQDGSKVIISDFVVYDLTKMFGAGNEPTTVEDFYARIPSGIDIHAYNEGEIISVNTEAIKTVGFNQWDEQWELGMFNTSTGEQDISFENIRNVNPIRVLPNTTYYEKQPSANNLLMRVLEYTQDGTYIGFKDVYNMTFTTSPNTAYVNFYMTRASGPAYKNDICINLSHTGVNNGKYKPYTPFTRELPIIKKYFPNGMRSAGTAFDSIEWDSSKQKWVAVRRIGSVDMGRLSWLYNDNLFGTNLGGGFYAYIINSESVRNNLVSNLLSPKLTVITADAMAHSAVNKTICKYNAVFVRDSDYTDANQFAEAYQGSILYYELAEPFVTEIEEENINFDYYVEDFGTEEALSDVPSAPFRADVVYTFNAVDTIRNNYLAIEAMKKQMAQMQNTISAMQVAQVKVEE